MTAFAGSEPEKAGKQQKAAKGQPQISPRQMK